MNTLEMQFGKRLKELRQAKSLTQEGLAEKVGVTCQAISNIERGLTGPSFGTLAALARVLGVRTKDLFDF